MGIGMGLIWLIILMVIAYIVYNLIKNEKILAPAKARRIFWLRGTQKVELTREQYMQMKEDLKKSSEAYLQSDHGLRTMCL